MKTYGDLPNIFMALSFLREEEETFKSDMADAEPHFFTISPPSPFECHFPFETELVTVELAVVMPGAANIVIKRSGKNSGKLVVSDEKSNNN